MFLGEVAIPQPVIADIAFGIERLPRSKRRKALQSRFDLICEIPPTEWTDAVSQSYGRIEPGLERRAHSNRGFRRGDCAKLITANLDHMARVPGFRSKTGVDKR
jgi:predicted nucleic acid-binding protein